MVINIKGIVQGVGFRPYIHKLVTEHCLYGWVKNTSNGVIIEIEGSLISLNEFVIEIEKKAPELSLIEEMEISIYEDLKGYKDFSIIKSTDEINESFTLISTDVCICDDCKRELFDKNNRRYRFPFINCTNCGPRFTIIKDIPYDRDKTTMEEFKFCKECNREYQDIKDRRYHAQPDCCFDCGPELFFEDSNFNRIAGDPISVACEYIRAGKIIAIKGIGGFHLACDAENIEAVNNIRIRKRRDEKPFAIMCKDILAVKHWCELDEYEEKLLISYRRPIVLLKKKNNRFDGLSPDNNYLGVMLPYTPVHFLLFENSIETLVMTSGNLSDTPIIYKNEEARRELKGIADGYLLNNRDIHVRCDDSLIRSFEGREYPLRRSRGYVPFPIKIEEKVSHILALGAEQKASFAIARENYVFLSQHIGELSNIETFINYEEQISHFEKLFHINPSKIVCDLHPDYMSREYAVKRAKDKSLPLYLVQHHHAHMAACMADNKLTKEVIGIIWDGTGYGENDEIWGGEILVGDYSRFTRTASIRPIRLPGGDKAIKEIYRIAYGMLYDIYGYIPEEYKFTENANYIESAIKNNINTPLASSIGRLFDGVAALLRIKLVASYEGQGAIALESIAIDNNEIYEYEIYNQNNLNLFDWIPLVKQILKDNTRDTPKGLIASKFMNTLSHMAAKLLGIILHNRGTRDVVLSGGVFQNIYLLSRVKRDLEEAGFKVYVHNRVSTNDEGIALGRILIAENGGEIKCV